MSTSILFVCDHGSTLGPMAEAFVRRHGWSGFVAYSAGIIPKPIHLFTFRVMEEIGYDLYAARSKSIFEFNHLPHVDFLITLSDQVNQHYVFNEAHIGSRLHWPFRDPVLEPWQSPQASLAGAETLLGFAPYASEDGYWLASTDTRLRVQPKKNLSTPAQVALPYDMQAMLKRFRRVRDEMECQVMNWLEEQGAGPFWWQR